MTEQTHSHDREQLEDLPPSALLVYRVLEEDQPRTQQEIIDEAYLCGRTCRYALTTLEEADLITSKPNPEDARQRLYSLCS